MGILTKKMTLTKLINLMLVCVALFRTIQCEVLGRRNLNSTYVSRNRNLNESRNLNIEFYRNRNLNEVNRNLNESRNLNIEFYRNRNLNEVNRNLNESTNSK